jgi:hypothetical protein
MPSVSVCPATNLGWFTDARASSGGRSSSASVDVSLAMNASTRPIRAGCAPPEAPAIGGEGGAGQVDVAALGGDRDSLADVRVPAAEIRGLTDGREGAPEASRESAGPTGPERLDAPARAGKVEGAGLADRVDVTGRRADREGVHAVGVGAPEVGRLREHGQSAGQPGDEAVPEAGE